MAKEEEAAQNFFLLHHRQQNLSFAKIGIFNSTTTTNNNITYNKNNSVYNINNKNIYSSSINNNNNNNNNSIFIVGGVVIVMLVLLVILVFIACKCKPWRLFFVSSSSPAPRLHTIKADEIKRPLISEDSSLVQSQSNDFARTVDVEGAGYQSPGGFSSSGFHGLAHIQKRPSTSHQLTHSDSFVLDIPDSSEDTLVGQTLRRPLATSQFADEQNLGRKEDVKCSSRFDIDDKNSKDFVPKYTGLQRSILMLEVISGHSRGLRYSVQSTNTSRLPLTLGRVSPSNVLVEDSEVSGKHALINWNVNKSKWELVDMGSLNGTHLNSKGVHHPQPGSRRWGDPVELSSGDVITLGTSSKIFIQITFQTEYQFPFGVGVASDPMALRRGGRKLPMEDVCYYQWPVPGTDQFGLFSICDGHGGAGAATSVSKIMPEIVAKILSDSYRREKVLSRADASDVLREAFSQTEACINHNYEGCTATVLLVWADQQESFYAQCANVGDSACFIDIDGKQIKMTEDHRVTSYSERLRIQATGEPLREGETRLCGLNLARMLGDKFLKEQDARFSSEPYTSKVVYIHQSSSTFALIASDGFWDVINVKKAAQLVQQIKEKDSEDHEYSPEGIANFLLNEARTQRTKDNTSIIFLDFDSSRMYPCKLDP